MAVPTVTVSVDALHFLAFVEGMLGNKVVRFLLEFLDLFIELCNAGGD